MKKISLFILTFINIFLISCSSEDNSNPEEFSLFDEWQLTKKTVGGTTSELIGCEFGESLIFTEDSEAKFIVVDYEGFNTDIVQEGFEECDYRYADYDLFIENNNESFYLIVPNEGEIYGEDDYIAKYEIEVLNSTKLQFKFIAKTSKGKIDDFEQNKVVIQESEQETRYYTRK